MTDLRFTCPTCGQSLEAPEDMLGQTLTCPSCNKEITLPSATATSPTTTPSAAETIFCQKCGERNRENNLKCTRCGQYLHAIPSSPPIDDSAAMRMIMPIGRSGWAIAAGYLGLFAVLILPAPFALLTGIIAVMDIRKHPDKHGMGRAVFGIILGALGSIVLILFLMASAFS